MAYNPQDTSGGMPDVELIEDGIHNARLVRVIELGEHDTQFGSKHLVVMGFLLPGVTMEINGETKQRMLWTFDLNKANNKDCTFNKYCRAINSTATSIDELIGKPCTIQVEIAKRKLDNSPYNKITNVVKPMVGVEIPPADCDSYYFDWDNPDKDVWDKLSENRQLRIKSALNYINSPVYNIVEGGEATSTSEEDSPI